MIEAIYVENRKGKISVDTFFDSLSFVLRAVDGSDPRAYMMGVTFDGKQFVATDGKRLHAYKPDRDCGWKPGFYIPKLATKKHIVLVGPKPNIKIPDGWEHIFHDDIIGEFRLNTGKKILGIALTDFMWRAARMQPEDAPPMTYNPRYLNDIFTVPSEVWMVRIPKEPLGAVQFEDIQYRAALMPVRI